MMYRPASYTPLDGQSSPSLPSSQEQAELMRSGETEWECVACKSDAERNWPSTTLATILVSMISCVLGGIMLVGRAD